MITPPAPRGSFMITKDLVSKTNTQVFAIVETPTLTSGVAVTLGLLTLAWPLAWAPGWTYLVAGAGAVAMLAAAFTGWRHGPLLAVAAAITSCAFSRAGTPVLAVEGLFILGYLLAADVPAGLVQPGMRARWLRRQALPCAAGLIASGAVLAALAVHQANSAWLTVAGLAAAVVAYLIALPRPRVLRPRRRRGVRLIPAGVPGTRAAWTGRRRLHETPSRPGGRGPAVA